MGKKSFVIILLVFALLLQTVTAQNEDIMTLLRQDAAGNQQTLGEYLWKLLHGKYTNLGDLAAGSFLAFLEEGVDQSFTLNGSSMTVYIINAIDGNEEFNPKAYYKVALVKSDDSESGMMIVQMDAIKKYVNSSLYPLLKTALNSSDSSSQLMKDLSGLLSKCTILPPDVSENSILENMWIELAGNPDSYPGIMALLNTPSEEPLVIFEKGPWYPEQDGVLTGLLDNIDSGAALLNTFNVFNTTPTDNPLSDDTSDTLQERIEELVKVLTITFVPNGGTGSMDPQETHVRIPTKLAANTFTLEGSRFIGWNTKADGSGVPYEDQDTISIEADTTLYAQWVIYEITQDSTVTEVDFIGEETMAEIEAKTEVTGVSLNEDEGAVQGLVDTALEDADEDTKAAVETANEIVIEIIVNVIPTEFEEESVSFRLEPKANIIAKDDRGNETPVAEDIDVTNDMIDKSSDIRVSIYVGFEPEQIIHYDDDGKVIEVFTKGNFTYNEASGVAEVVIHRFSTLTAAMNPLTVDVTFDPNGGTGTMEKQQFVYGTPQKLSANAFSFSNHEFIGWNTRADGSGKSYADREQISDLMENMTLYAQWTYKDNGGNHSSGFFPIFCEDCQLPQTGFSSRYAVELPARPNGLSYDALGLSLFIPRFDVAAELVSIPQTGNSWSVEWLGDQAGLLEGSALPGEGYSLIAAHNTLNSTEYGPFALLSQLEESDRVFVRTGQNDIMSFSVYANELLDPSDFESVKKFAEREPGSLVLITCENELVEGGYLNRRVIFAKPL